MIKKGNILYSILKMKCPQCHEGAFFKSSVYDLKNLGEIKEECSSCGCKYSKEPGFYYGAMYVSYGMGIAMFVAVFLLTYLLYPTATATVYTIILLTVMIVLGPLIYALSKIVWANMFISYKVKKEK